MPEIRKAAVLGAGVMGAGIAAHLTNADVPVVLLDIVPEGATSRKVVAEGAVERMLKTQPAAFMHKRNASLITPGNIEDHMARLADADWIVEAVVERLDVKHAVYEKIEAVRKDNAIVSSNTSTIPLGDLTVGMSARFKRNFLITHFFNPPRYMRLLEVVSGKHTRPQAVDTIRNFADAALGKGVVMAKDTPGFIGNRIGVFWLQCALLEAIELGLTVEEADAVMSKPVGIPRTGVFGLLDLVGLDLQPHVLESMHSSLPKHDAFQKVFRVPELVLRMIDDGYTGRKGKGGFYRINKASGNKVKEAIDLVTGEYRAAVTPQLESLAQNGGLRALASHEDKGGRYAWRVLSQTLSYAASLVPEIADDIVAVDGAMKLGYNWKFGPFELLDQLGPAWFAERLQAESKPVPELLAKAGSRSFYEVDQGHLHYLNVDGGYSAVPRASGVLLLADIKRSREPITRNVSASLWDIDDGVLCLEFHTKMNALDPNVLSMIQQAIDIVPEQYKALVIYNESRHFSAGANLGLLLYAANMAAWSEIESMVRQGQEAYRALKYAPFPVVGAPAGMALGGGCEVLLHCDAIQAHAETYIGLVEVGAGVVPAWGGCKEMLLRWMAHPNAAKGPMPPVMKVFETISTAVVAKSAAEAQVHRFLRPDDGITMNRDRLLADAKAKALALARNYTPPQPPEIHLPGPTAKAALEMAVDNFRRLGKATAHDEHVAKALAEVVSGGDADITDTLSEDDVLALERAAFMQLVRHSATLARMEHLLETGKPLRN
ncbi:MAG: 3-hydroxyacyl-CoA dehydrogenase NAD-binding domain-containing protein [Acidiferrobacterales bacterium]